MANTLPDPKRLVEHPRLDLVAQDTTISGLQGLTDPYGCLVTLAPRSSILPATSFPFRALWAGLVARAPHS